MICIETARSNDWGLNGILPKGAGVKHWHPCGFDQGANGRIVCDKRFTGKAFWKHAIFPDPVFLKSDKYYKQITYFVRTKPNNL